MPSRKQNGTIHRSIGRKEKVMPPSKRVLGYVQGADVIGRTALGAITTDGRALAPAAAVRECAFLSDQFRARFDMPPIDWKTIVATLQAKKIPFVLTGAHGISVWLVQPRST